MNEAAMLREMRKQQEMEELQRSARFMDFDEKEVNEYVSSGEEEEKIVEEVKGGGSEIEFNMSGRKNKPGGSMIFKPFKPGKYHAGLR